MVPKTKITLKTEKYKHLIIIYSTLYLCFFIKILFFYVDLFSPCFYMESPWNNNVICFFATRGQTEGNFHKTFISKPIFKVKHLIHISIYQIVKEAGNHDGMASPLQISFLCTKYAQDKHKVPASQKKVFPLSDIH